MFFNGRASGRAWITFQDALAASKALALDDTGRSVFASLSVLIHQEKVLCFNMHVTDANMACSSSQHACYRDCPCQHGGKL